MSKYKLRIIVLLSMALSVLVIVSGLLIYLRTTNVMKDMVLEAGGNTVVQLQQSLEMVVEVLRSSLLEASLNKNLEMFADSYENLDIFDQEALYQNLLRLRATSKYISSLYVYYWEHERVIDTNSNNPRFISVHDLPQEDMLKFAQNNYVETRQSGPYFFADAQQETEGVLTMAMPSSPLAAVPRALIVITLNQSYFKDILQHITVETEASIYVLDSENRLMFSKNNKNNALNEEVLKRKNNESQRLEADGVEYLISSHVSSQTGWQYIYGMPEKMVYKGIEANNIYLLILLLVVLLFVVVIAFLTAEKFYQPVKNIVTALSEESTPPGDVRDEVDYINTRIQTMINDKKSVESLLQENQPVLKEFALQKFLNGELKNRDVLIKKLDYYRVSYFPQGLYVCAVMGIDQIDAMTEQYNEQQIDTLYLFLREVVSCCLPPERYAVDFWRGQNSELVLWISVLSTDAQGEQQRMQDIWEEIFTEVTSPAQMAITLGVGEIVNDLTQVPLSYEQAVIAHSHRIVAGGGQIIYHSLLPPLRKTQPDYPFELEKEIFDSLRHLDLDRVEHSLDVFFQEVKENFSDGTKLKHVYMQLFNDTMRFLIEISVNSGIVFENPDAMYDEVLLLDTLHEAKRYFLRMFGQIYAYAFRRKEGGDEEVSAQIIRFVDENFDQEEISLELLSQKLHFSVSYLAKHFKNTTGKSIREYIIEKRIEKGRELLKNSDMKIVDVAKTVGYPNVRSFINIFKKYTGETPGEFKVSFRGDA